MSEHDEDHVRFHFDRIDVHLHGDTDQKLDTIIEMLKAQRGQEEHMLKQTQDLIDEVSGLKTVTEGVELTIDTLLAKVEANADDPVAIQAAVDEFRNDKARIAAAVVKGTTAAPAEPPPTP